MPTFEFTSPEGKTYEISGPEGATQEQAFQILQQQLSQGEAKYGPLSREESIKQIPAGPGADQVKQSEPRSFLDKARGVVEAGASIASQAALTPIALAAVPFKGEKGFQSVMSEAYQPRGEAGQDYAETVGRYMGALPPVIPHVGVPQARAAKARIGAAVEEAAVAEAPKPSPFSSPEAKQTISQAEQKAKVEGRKTLSVKAQKEAISEKEAQIKAEEATKNAGINWSKLPVTVRKRITEVAKNATEPGELTPEMVKRAALLESLPVPAKGTKGQLARDPIQLRTEQQLAQTKEGELIHERHIEQNKALVDSISTLEGRIGAKSKTEADVGRRVSGALERQINESRSNYEKLYRIASNSPEGNKPVSVKPLVDYLNESLNPEMTQFAETALKKMGVIKQDAAGNWMPVKDIPIKQLEEVRKIASRQMAGGGTQAHYAGDVASSIDKIMEGAGGENYKAAREAFKKHKMDFEETGAIEKITADKSRVDRKVALENVFDQVVLKGSTQDTKNVIDQLLSAEKKGTRKEGRKAVTELAGQTVKYIKEQATKGITTDELGNVNLSPANLQKALERIGDDKLKLLIGETQTAELKKVLEASKVLKTSPPKRIQGSDTAINTLTMLDAVLSKVPGVGGTLSTIKGGAKMVKNAQELGKAEQTAKKALMTSPKEERALTLRQLKGMNQE